MHLVGRRVRIPAGTPIRSMAPNAPDEPQPSSRSQVVIVDHVIGGYTQPDDGRHPTSVPTYVRWAGSGGYWRAAPAAAVELLRE